MSSGSQAVPCTLNGLTDGQEEAKLLFAILQVRLKIFQLASEWHEFHSHPIDSEVN